MSMMQQYTISTPLTSLNTAYNTCNTDRQNHKSSYYSHKAVQLQVNISIGKNKYLLQVQKCSNLHNEVQKFLKNHNINLKYEGIILSMVRQQLAKKQKQKQTKHNIQNHGKRQMQYQEKLLELKEVKSQIEIKKKQYQLQKKQESLEKKQICLKKDQKIKVIKTSTINISRQNKQNYLSHYNSKSNHRLSTQAPSQIKDQTVISEIIKDPKQISQQQAKSQNIYQKWKIKQKIKQKEKIKNMNTTITPNKSKTDKMQITKEKQQNKDKQKLKQKGKSKSQKKLETHSPDHFYNKGLKFKQVRQDHIQQIYKEKYPFQLHRDASLTPTKKNQLHQRLYKEHRVKIEQKNEKKLTQLLHQKEKNSKPPAHTSISIDKYKRKVMERNSKINEALHYLIQNKMIENPYKIEKVSKSPFRNN